MGCCLVHYPSVSKHLAPPPGKNTAKTLFWAQIVTIKNGWHFWPLRRMYNSSSLEILRNEGAKGHGILDDQIAQVDICT